MKTSLLLQGKEKEELEVWVQIIQNATEQSICAKKNLYIDFFLSLLQYKKLIQSH